MRGNFDLENVDREEGKSMFLEDEEVQTETQEEQANIKQAVQESMKNVPSTPVDTELSLETEDNNENNIIVNSPKDLWGLGSIKLMGRVESGDDVVRFMGQCVQIWGRLRETYSEQLMSHATSAQLSKIQALCWETGTNLDEIGVVAATLTVFEAGQLIQELQAKADKKVSGEQRAPLTGRGRQPSQGSSPRQPLVGGRGGGGLRGLTGGNNTPTLKQVAYLAFLNGDITNGLFNRVKTGSATWQDLPVYYQQIENQYTSREVSDAIQQAMGK